MRIQMVFYNNPDYYPPTINSAKVLAEVGYTVNILCRDYAPTWMPAAYEDYPANVHLVRIKSKLTQSILAYLNFLSVVIRRADPHTSAIIVYDIHALLPGRLLSTIHGYPLIYHCHDYVDDERKKTASLKIFKVIERLFAKTADVVIVPDKERAQMMVKQLNLRKFPIIVANAALQRPNMPNSSLRAAIGELGKSFEKIVFRQGYISQGHCIEVTLRSMPMWDNTNWGFIIMGHGDTRYKQSLQQLAIDLGVQERFIILPAVSYSHVLSFISGADLGHGLYEPSHFNNKFITTASNKVMEYIAVGIPLLLTDTAGNRDLIARYNNGTTATYDSPESIASAINRLFGNPSLLKLLSRNSSRAFDVEYNYTKQFEPVIAQLGLLVK